MPELPKKVSPNQPILAKDWNALLDCVAAIWPKRSGDIAPNMASGGGTSYSLLRAPRSSPGSTAVAAVNFPFEIYQHNVGNPSTDWRTVRIRGGTVNGAHPTGDDTNVTPLNLIVPASTALYKIWLHVAINTSGTLTAYGLAGGATGWDGYPAQPSGSGGNPPSDAYCLIGEVATSDDTAKALSILPQSVRTALYAAVLVVNYDCTLGAFTYGVEFWT